MGKFKNFIGYATAPITGGASLLMTDTAQKAWNDFTGKTAQQRANEANMAEAEKNRAWQEKMSNTAYQRQAQDLLTAGLNPTAATSLGGASTGSGAQAEIAPEPSDSQGFMNAANIAGTVAGGFSEIGAGVNQMAQAARTSAETPFVPQAQKANIANTTADTVQKQAQTQNINANTEKTKAETDNLRKEWELLDNETRKQILNWETEWKNASTNKAKAEIEQEFYNSSFGRKFKQFGLSIESLLPVLGPIGRFSK